MRYNIVGLGDASMEIAKTFAAWKIKLLEVIQSVYAQSCLCRLRATKLYTL